MKRIAAGAVLLALTGAAAACGEAFGAGAQRIEAPAGQIAWRATPSPIPVSRHFTLDIELCPAAGQPLPAAIGVDATMPEHRHGMNYKASVTPAGPGRWRAEGLLFHMPGRWELVFEWRDATGAPRRLAQRVDVE
jgi:hypothetical protein